MLKDNYNTVDLLKFLGSLLIFMLHLNIFGDFTTLRLPFELLARWVVPFFFIVSSFFLFKKEEPNSNSIDNQTLIKYIKRIAILYAAWFIVNLPSTIYLQLIRPGIGQIETWLSFIKTTLLSTTFAGSWYLLSSMFSAYMLYIMSKRFNTRSCILISIIPFVLCLLSSAYGGLLPVGVFNLLRWLRFPLNIFGGLLYFSVGKYLYENKEKLLKRSSFFYIGLAVLFLALYIIEIKITIKAGVYKFSDFALCLLPLSFIIAILGIKGQIKIQHPKVLREVSTIVYCAQGNILCAVSAAKYIGVTTYLQKGLIGFILMLLTVGAIFYLQKVHKIQWVGLLT